MLSIAWAVSLARARAEENKSAGAAKNTGTLQASKVVAGW